jgi:tRNA (cmo5U34)-methyltransferase
MSKTSVDFFNQEMAKVYDERNSKLSKISECFHFLIGMVLKDLPTNARILCVGAGTGAEILYLSKIYPDWRFVALEPSAPMLEVCRERTRKEGFENNCEYVCGYLEDTREIEEYDAVLSILVGHFVSLERRPRFYRDMICRLKKGGKLVNLEISFDLKSLEFPLMLKNWEHIQSLMGATAESLASLPIQLKEMLTIKAPTEIEEYIKKGGINHPVPFFQAFLIQGIFGIKDN